MIDPLEILAVKKEILLPVPPFLEYKAVITAIEDNLFWISLPKQAGQVLVLQEKQHLEIRVPMRYGLYSANTRVVKIGNHHHKFYGLSMPDRFQKLQARQFVRADHATNVLFSYGSETAQTSMLNFSEGGCMVYVTPSLEKMLQNSEADFKVSFQVKDECFSVLARLAWRKIADYTPYAGFQFTNLSAAQQQKLADLAAQVEQSQKGHT
ncbi:PilZ domain-containing protein [Desulforamulus hydrothermalis]|uniref:Type IV pilus assembly PilZ n=1 Tax=Desulforamulus hydrothermalis Lam5 = DSM 18033 TaxID=1121428 RepID=K8EH43_9FIRM|nr:PilZ domain-containing protein [Desulforamulus hydrothermalis]CCO07946.1 Type IV pilus assembly PilZ [Desulforamulus hydrothermalis Lam5 = DSM 18033]SHG85648.1 c-di-GMP-binding flagellar brake protein YcgR, contains PilZNR and PilZ domains [Desulforamulus hydrothermalis Lam5 = DSM 18033]